MESPDVSNVGTGPELHGLGVVSASGVNGGVDMGHRRVSPAPECAEAAAAAAPSSEGSS